MKFSQLKKLLSGTGGQEIAEAAIVLPLLFMLLLGIYWFGRAFNIYGTINHAAREGARVGIVSTCASCSIPNNPASNAQIASAVTQALQASKLDPNSVSVYSPSLTFCGGLPASCNSPSSNGNITICSNVQFNVGSSSPVCGTSVSFKYPFQFWFPFTSLNMQKFLLTADVQMKTEN